MRKRILSIVLTVAMLITVAPCVYAAEEETPELAAVSEELEETPEEADDTTELMADGIYYDEWGIYFKESTGTITGCSKDRITEIKDLTLPNEIDGVSVTSIGFQTFSDCRGLTRITVNEENANYTSVD